MPGIDKRYLITLAAIATAWLVVAMVGLGHAIEIDLFSKPVTPRAYSSLSSVPAGGQVQIAVVLELAEQWHVNANEINDEFLIPTTVSLETPVGFEVKGTVYPKAIEKKFPFSDKPLLLFEKEASIGVLLEVAPDVEPGDTKITAVVTYQACDSEKCLAPETKRIELPIRVSAPTEAIDATHADIFSRIDFASVTGLANDGADGQGSRLGAIISRRGYIVAFLLVFVWGLALNLTPCVYPIIPITVSYFGGQARGQTSRTFLLAAVYVLGMALMYSTLGLIAALTGSILGNLLQNELVVGFVALVLVALAMSMFGLYEIRVPARLSNLAGASSGKQGSVGALLMGLTVGIVAAPCIGPFVLALLTFVGESGNPVLGFTLFFTLALGLGFPFLFLAVLSGSITRLPKSGEWMEWVKKLFGVILIAMAIFFLQPHIEDLTYGNVIYWTSMGALFIIAGIFLGFFKKMESNALLFLVFRRFVGIAAPLFGLYLILTPGHIIASGSPKGGIVWNEYDDKLLVQAKKGERYVLIDFAADWCLPCKELDHKTFSRQEVVTATSEFVTLKADLTNTASDEVRRLRERYRIRGVPTVVFLDKNGAERKDLRVFGFVDKTEFIERVNKLKAGT
ncbi:MAG: thioredoxin family protein [Candidatus Krumholzibacteria bacterium]|nr:thioredoxin family protein [Candidatus Krumholzibacteria bacterium]